MPTNAVREKIKAFIVSQFPRARVRGFMDTDALLESGVLDSLGVLELVAYLEKGFEISITEEHLVMENFQTIERIAAFVEGQLETHGLSRPSHASDER